MSGALGLSPLQAYMTYSANEAKYANAQAAGSGQETGLIAYFQQAASGITTPDALLKDYKALSVVVGAFNLAGSINSTALLRQLMTQDPTSTSSVAYRSGNAKFIAFANALHNWNPPPFSTADGVASIIASYKTNQFEAGADQQNPGLQNALYFTRTAGSIKTLTQLQSDPALLAVAVTGIGLPLTAFENLDFSQQTALLKQNLNPSDLQKPGYVQHLAELYLVQQQLNTGFTTPLPQPGSVLTLFSGSDSNAADGGNGVLSILESSSGTTSSLLGTTTVNNPVLSLFA